MNEKLNKLKTKAETRQSKHTTVLKTCKILDDTTNSSHSPGLAKLCEAAEVINRRNILRGLHLWLAERPLEHMPDIELEELSKQVQQEARRRNSRKKSVKPKRSANRPKLDPTRKANAVGIHASCIKLGFNNADADQLVGLMFNVSWKTIQRYRLEYKSQEIRK